MHTVYEQDRILALDSTGKALTSTSSRKHLSTVRIALTAVFTALYVVLGLVVISPMIGLSGKAITAAAIIAPLIGVLLGPYVGVLSTLFGGVIGYSLGVFVAPNVASGVAASLLSGLMWTRKKPFALLLYICIFLAMSFFPEIGPVWLFPAYSWFQMIGLVLLIPSLYFANSKNPTSIHNPRVVAALFTTCLCSALAGQMAGTLTFEIMISGNTATALSTWVFTAFIYPVERTVIAVFATALGVSLLPILKAANLMPDSGRGDAEKSP
jgi:hypothetical protein